MLTMKTIDSFNNVIIVDVKMPWLLTHSSLLPLRVTRARGFSIAVVSNIEDIVTLQCRCQGLNNILYTLAKV